MTQQKIKNLLKKGVRIPNPESIEIGDDVDTGRISGEDVAIHAGCRIYGPATLVLRGAKIGYQGPATVENCFVGPEVHLNGGYFRKAVFLKGASIGLGAQVREGTILEEGAGAAHTVGLKQTILFPFVTLGSLINFCDCFMAGGTGRNNHSEVGSAYIHFNFTPNQDKATASLLGDVPRGVMLDQHPVFLGGQGGLVGPCRLTFGTVTAAGTICRKDELRPDRLVFGEIGKGGSIPYRPGSHQNIVRVVRNNIFYVANLIALLQWYEQVRAAFISDDFPEPLHEGLKQTLHLGIEERLKQLGRYSRIVGTFLSQEKGTAPHHLHHRELSQRWPELEAFFHKQLDRPGDLALRDRFLEAFSRRIDQHGTDYIGVVRKLAENEKRLGTLWLQGLVDDTVKGGMTIIPSFDLRKKAE